MQTSMPMSRHVHAHTFTCTCNDKRNLQRHEHANVSRIGPHSKATIRTPIRTHSNRQGSRPRQPQKRATTKSHTKAINNRTQANASTNTHTPITERRHTQRHMYSHRSMPRPRPMLKPGPNQCQGGSRSESQAKAQAQAKLKPKPDSKPKKIRDMSNSIPNQSQHPPKPAIALK